jgi:lysozyme
MNALIQELLKKHEGLRLKPYRCTAGKLTIGYGRNLEDKGITEEEAEKMLLNDIAEVERELEQRVRCFHQLTTTRRAVLINMAVNMGVRGLLKFKLFLKDLENGEYKHASREMLNSRWARQVGSRAIELSELIKRG